MRFWPVVLLVATFSTAHAEESIRLMTGGPSTAEKIALVKGQLEKAAGARIDVSINPVDVAVVALTNRVIDGVIGPLEASIDAAETRLGKKLNRDEFIWTEASRSSFNIGVHPSNPVGVLTRQQITDILSGKVTSWDTINGQKMPLTVLMAKNYIAATRTLCQFYLKSDTSPMAQFVLNKDGLINGIKNNKGAIGFFTAPESLPDFSPKFMPTEAHMVNMLIVRKDMRTEVKKLFEFLKSKPDVLQSAQAN